MQLKNIKKSNYYLKNKAKSIETINEKWWKK